MYKKNWFKPFRGAPPGSKLFDLTIQAMRKKHLLKTFYYCQILLTN